MTIDRLDHLVLTVRNISETCAFYKRVLGFRTVTFEGGRKALHFGQQKINLHEWRAEFEPKAASPTPGSADLCFITCENPAAIIRHLSACGVEVLEGPVEQIGTLGPMTSVYFRDPDGNLIEVSRYEGDRG